MDWKSNMQRLEFSPKLFCRCNSIPVNISIYFFFLCGILQTYSYCQIFYGKAKANKDSQDILEEEKEVGEEEGKGRLALSDIKAHWKLQQTK